VCLVLPAFPATCQITKKNGRKREGGIKAGIGNANDPLGLPGGLKGGFFLDISGLAFFLGLWYASCRDEQKKRVKKSK